MLKGAMTLLVFCIVFLGCTNLMNDPLLLLSSLLEPRIIRRIVPVDGSVLPMKQTFAFGSSLTSVVGREMRAHANSSPPSSDSGKEEDMKVPAGAPDLVVKDVELTEDLELSIFLSNAGEMDLRKGATLRVRIFLNDRKISDFEHFTSDVLKARLGNHYILHPPYGVGMGGTSRVKISVSPKLPSDDFRLENNTLERTFMIFPFRIGPRGKQEFSFALSQPRTRPGNSTEKVRAEARWDGVGSKILLTLKRSGQAKNGSSAFGRSPLKLTSPMPAGEVQKQNLWKVSLANPIERKLEGHLIIQHP